MTKRWKKIIALAVAATLGVTSIPMMTLPKQVEAAEMVEQSDSERKLSFNKGWKFFLGKDGSIDASGKKYDD